LVLVIISKRYLSSKNNNMTRQLDLLMAHPLSRI